MKGMQSNEIKKLQIDMLVEFAEYCDRNHLHFMLCGGTLLGAVRHKGFIPWDDDVDLMMPRPDYEKLLKLAAGKKDISETVEVVSYRLNNGVHPFIKLNDKRTFVEDGFSNYKGGVWIDIFPVDGNFSSKILACIHYKCARILRKLVECQIYDINVEKRKITKLIRYLIHPVLKIIPHNRLCSALDAVSRVKAFESSRFAGRVLSGYGTRQKTVRDNFMNPVPVEFEGHQFPAPSNYDEILTRIYGAYMTLPPEEQRVSHGITAYWKKD